MNRIVVAEARARSRIQAYPLAVRLMALPSSVAFVLLALDKQDARAIAERRDNLQHALSGT